ncbi:MULTISPECIES: pyridoxal phosphate-dependent decarboxylase family protein [Salinivibrio]|uniref:pyridoxal phosphate-dependent decarboxylase family protein n=1 Tax=Salinivibrio TaxID=51366 RepID=UPI000987B7F9|nr:MULTISPECIES: pyridoxal-dependent decarboxylase [Salinivibrio]OOF11802.1 aspartate aminotransferase family protein [Salinivibrio sp. PR919]OOF16730.1 aspartate aminotransferase family protein [Salinivibrio sp. PR932]OOF31266.1 aspartate aminotransferase family protein [Salinivibrio proteolyticus]
MSSAHPDGYAITPTFAKHYQTMRAHFFNRDPNRWPIYRTPGLAQWLEQGMLPAPTSPDIHLLEQQHVPSHSDLSHHIFPPLALHAATHSKDWTAPQAVENVITAPCDPAIHGALLATLANPNLVYSEYAGLSVELEQTIVRQVANLIGYDDQRATGLFTQGGTFGNLYGYLLGLRKQFPLSGQRGLQGQDFRMINSLAGHYSNMTNLGLLGTDIPNQVLRVKVDARNRMDLDDFAYTLNGCLAQGLAVPTILLTFGTTDTFAIDDIERVYQIRERACQQYNVVSKPHIHVDAAVGWPLIMFNDYDFNDNPLGINTVTAQKLAALLPRIRGLRYADSITIDFQKWGFVPYTSSLVMFKNSEDMECLKQDPHYFSYFEASKTTHTHLQSTIECSRGAAGAYGAYCALNMLGKRGYQTMIAHGLQNAEYLKGRLSDLPYCKVVARENLGPTVAFRLYQPADNLDVDTLFEREQKLHQLGARIDSITQHSLFHREHFLARQGRKLHTNWVESIAHTEFDTDGQCLFIPGEKAVFLNPYTEQRHISEFVDALMATETEQPA